MSNWFRAGEPNTPTEGGRFHVCIENRYLTVFRYHGKLSVIDSICYHAGGPLTEGPLQDIEDLGVRVVLCPWHRYMVSISDGAKVYRPVEIDEKGKPKPVGWKVGKVVQRSHLINEDENGIYIALNLSESEDSVPSDQLSCNDHCGAAFTLHSTPPCPIPH